MLSQRKILRHAIGCLCSAALSLQRQWAELQRLNQQWKGDAIRGGWRTIP
jgi:hypothetical protein